MRTVVLNLIFYVSGLIALLTATFAGVMYLDIEKDASVIALMLVSPLLVWVEVWAYNYFFEGCELLASESWARLATIRQEHFGRKPIPTKTSLLHRSGSHLS